MGEYYNWVNVDTKEYICPCDFDFGNKLWESSQRNNAFLLALRELLDKEWKGCRVFWMGDECGLPDNLSSELFDIIAKDCEAAGYPGDLFDTVFETYRNLSCLFKKTENEVREEIKFYVENYASGGCPPVNMYGIDLNNPFKGLFEREGKSFKYTVNYSKKVCYSFEDTKILFKDRTECDFLDPLPRLLRYGKDKQPGPWVGDIIGVMDTVPEEITILDKIYIEN